MVSCARACNCLIPAEKRCDAAAPTDGDLRTGLQLSHLCGQRCEAAAHTDGELRKGPATATSLRTADSAARRPRPLT
eukprot:11525449-Heterocapsa_arctica.AAC.1